MDLLPNELYPFILSYLDFYDLLSVRTVCRKFRNIVQDFKIKELVRSKPQPWRDAQRTKGNWFRTGRPYEFSNTIDDDLQWLLDKSILNFQFLKRARVDWLEPLNSFKHLEQVEIFEKCEKVLSSYNVKLVLPKLKAFLIAVRYWDRNDKFSLELETPKLSEVSIRAAYPEKIKFNYPLVVHYLKIGLERRVYLNETIAVFENLEILEFAGSPLLKADILNNFPKLNALKFDAKMSLVEFIEKRKELGANFQIYYLGVKHAIGNDFLYHPGFNVSRMQFYLKHYKLLDDDLSKCFELQYEDLVERRVTVDDEFFRKFSNIQKISKPVEKPEQLVCLISGCPNLFELSLTCSGLSNQTFYDRLPEISSLFVLQVYSDPAGLRLDFGFLGRMKQLEELWTDHDLALDERQAPDLFRYFKCFSFSSGGRFFSLLKSDVKGKYVLQVEGVELPNQGSSKEVLRWCDHIRKKDERSKRKCEAWKTEFKKSRKLA